jgi:hypothetical protein
MEAQTTQQVLGDPLSARRFQRGQDCRKVTQKQSPKLAFEFALLHS